VVEKEAEMKGCIQAIKALNLEVEQRILRSNDLGQMRESEESLKSFSSPASEDEMRAHTDRDKISKKKDALMERMQHAYKVSFEQFKLKRAGSLEYNKTEEEHYTKLYTALEEELKFLEHHRTSFNYFSWLFKQHRSSNSTDRAEVRWQPSAQKDDNSHDLSFRTAEKMRKEIEESNQMMRQHLDSPELRYKQTYSDEELATISFKEPAQLVEEEAVHRQIIQEEHSSHAEEEYIFWNSD